MSKCAKLVAEKYDE